MYVLECNNLSKSYGSKRALERIDLQLGSGRILGLLGPNGSGKTTLIKLAEGLLQPTDGQILIGGKVPGVETKAQIAYLPDREFLPDYMTVEQLLRYYADFFQDFDMERAEMMLKNLNINKAQRMKKLSKGTKEKVQLILTMSRDAKIYILDEPIAGVDPAARDYILKTIISNYSPDSLVIICTHLIADIESVLDEVVFLKEGRVVLHRNADELREETGKNIDGLFREVFRC
ncbi:MAG: ABC transporter ATP-binding protein [Firmicutes bacterium]|nr:ABC transporter ATP-binding protein [Bacillota bacterium]